MERTFEMLRDEYVAAAEIVSARIHKKRKELQEIGRPCNRYAVIESELGVLYRERSDALEAVNSISKYCASANDGGAPC